MAQQDSVCVAVFGKRWVELTDEERAIAFRYRRKTSYYRNHAANVERQRKRKRFDKRDLLKALNRPARCEQCGYDRYLGALDFHHIDRTTKEGHVMTLPWAQALDEASKCRVLCSNCHREEHQHDTYETQTGRPREADPLLEKYMRASGVDEDVITEAMRGRHAISD